MIFVIPMAGFSQRFQDAGYKKPKYKLSLAGSPVFSHAVRSFEAYFKKHSFLFIHRAEEGIERFIISECETLGVESPILVELSEVTRGQAETVAKGLKAAKIGDKVSIAIFNIDTFRPKFNFPRQFDLDKIDGYLEVFKGSGTNWSYVRTISPDTFRVVETAEKVQISDLCCTGLYYFREAGKFKKAFEMHVDDNPSGELYVAPLYNHLIRTGADIFYHEIQLNEVTFCGIPEEYELLKKNWENRNE